LAVTDVEVIFRLIPAMPSKTAGRRPRTDCDSPDGNLFKTTGDRSDSPPRDVAQKLDNHLGKSFASRPMANRRRAIRSSASLVLPEIWAYGCGARKA
jgi:glucose/arabinose dehydrogenase